MILPSPTSRHYVPITTIGMTLATTCIALLADLYDLTRLDTAAERCWSIFINVMAGVFIGGPCSYLFARRSQRLTRERLELERIATTDGLTAVLNRGAFTMLVEAYLNEAGKNKLSVEGALLLVDADHFKTINDNHGHQAGDRVLKMIAASINGNLRTSDLVGRLGGEEFGVFLPATEAPDAFRIAERIRCSVRAGDAAGIRMDNVTVSVGGATFRGAVSYERLFALADMLLYEAKAAGRNCVRMREHDRNRMTQPAG